jgi:enoyl-[acyl-carrier protein] reductase I
MIPLDLSGKVAVVTGVGDDLSLAWYIAKTLQAAGAKLYLACHPRMVNIVENILTRGPREGEPDERLLPFGAGMIQVEKVLACDVQYDTLEDAEPSVREDRRWNKHGDFSIAGMIANLMPLTDRVDILIHSVAFSAEIKKQLWETTRKGYLTALSISSYSLIGLTRPLLPLMEKGQGAAVVGLTYLGGARVVPHYGGGMSTAKAALEIDAKQLASNLGPKGVRVNLISAGPYASRAARSIADIEAMKAYAASRSPLPRPIEAQEVANATAFLCSPLASAITGEVLYVDCGYNVMGV